MIVEPANGKLPELTPEGKRRSALMKSSWAAAGETAQIWDAPEDFDSWDRCITRGMPSSMMPYRYNNGIEIFQAPGMVGAEPRDDSRGSHRLHGRAGTAEASLQELHG
jgi:hypothetical protein